jgi:hypothetical protein
MRKVIYSGSTVTFPIEGIMNWLNVVATLLALLLACTQYEQGVPAVQPNTGLVSFPLGDENFGEYHVSAVYYPIHGNIDSQTCPMFVSVAPTPEQSLNFSMNAPVYSWTIYRGFSELKTITLDERFDGWKSHWTWYVVDAWHRTCQRFPAYFAGQLTEHRFRELTKPDSLYSAALMDADSNISALFGDVQYAVIPYYRIRRKLDNFIMVQRLNDPTVDICNVQQGFVNGTPGMNAAQSSQSPLPSAATPKQGTPAASVDPFIVRSIKLDSIDHACLMNLYTNQTLMTRNHIHCSIDETIRMFAVGGPLSSGARQLTHNLPELPYQKHDFTFALFPSFQPRDTFSLIEETAQSITFAVASSNQVFRAYLSNTVLKFDRSSAALAELTAMIFPPAEATKWSPLTIRYKLQGETILPFGSSYIQKMIHEGKPVTMEHTMNYRY